MLCNKCRVAKPFGDDTWCLACSAVEALASELKSRWEFPALREAAEESIISTARQVKSLKKLSVGLASERAAAKSKEPAKSAAALLAEPRIRSPLPRSTSRASRPSEVKKEVAEKEEDSPDGEDQDSYTEAEEEAETTLPGASRLPLRLSQGFTSGRREWSWGPA